MADEPRRSGRATKGVNHKNLDEPEPLLAPKTKKGKSKQEAAAGDESSADIIRCVCGDNRDSPDPFISCDKCGVWQHNDCMGLSDDEDDLPSVYFCEQCKPADHKELLAAMKRGEQPWIQRRAEGARKRQEEEQEEHEKAPKTKGKRAKGGRATKTKEADSKSGKSASPAQMTPDPTVSDKGKRKLEVENGADGDAKPAKLRRSSVQDVKEKTRQSKRKSESTAPDVPSPGPVADADAIVGNIADLQDPSRRGCATFLRTKFDTQIKELNKRGEYRIPDGHTAASIAESLAIAVERAMFINHRGSGPKPDFGGSYKQQMTTIGSNIVQNSTLMLRLLSESVTPDEISKMSSDDMASEELQRQMASMREEAEKQSTLVHEELNRPLVRRTHKGEELVDDQANQMSSESIVSAPPVRRRESVLDGPESPVLQGQRSPDGALSEARSPSVAKPLVVDTSRPAPTATGDITRRSSSTFDIKSVWSSVQSPEIDPSPRFGSKPHQDSGATPSHPEPKLKSEHDPDIDRLLDEDGTDSPPYSPGEVSGPAIVWRGLVDMPITGGSVAKFRAFTQHVAGSDLGNKVKDLVSIYPETLELSGRIPKDKADEYLLSLSSSRSTDVSVHNLRPADAEQSTARAEFDKLFKYFIDRNRYGVVADALHRDHVTDMYIIPLEAGLTKMPLFLERLGYNIIEAPPPRPLILVVFILKWKNSVAPPTPMVVNNTESTPAAMSPPASIPTGQSSAMSPRARPGSQQSFPPPPSGMAPGQPSAFPGNPYAPPPLQALSPLQIKNIELGRQVLGDLVGCKTAQEVILNQEIEMPVILLENLRKVFQDEPLAQNDFNVFSRVIQLQ